MKELSIEEKAKRYDEAIEELRGLLEGIHEEKCEIMEEDITDIFPELKESEDEKIRKELIKFVKVNIPDEERYIAWLEKQGEQKPILDFKASDWYVSKVDGKIHNIYHSVDKVEPKFKVGDWIIYRDEGCTEILKISGVTETHYICIDISDDYCRNLNINFIDNHNYHLWTIQDAKDGDVLSFDDNTIVIFKDLYNATTFHSYCHIEDGVFDVSKDDMPDWWEGKGFHPATKGQCGLLFQKMKEAGYEWDPEKKELRKTEQKQVIDYPDNLPKDNWELVHEFIEKFGRIPEDEDELNALVEYILKRQKSSWSEEDKKILSTIIEEGDLKPSERIWIKSLKDRVQHQNTWKPSDEQLEALEHFVRSIGESGYASPYDNNTKLLYLLLEQLKKLKGE